jgi:hypothetical protein
MLHAVQADIAAVVDVLSTGENCYVRFDAVPDFASSWSFYQIAPNGRGPVLRILWRVAFVVANFFLSAHLAPATDEFFKRERSITWSSRSIFRYLICQFQILSSSWKLRYHVYPSRIDFRHQKVRLYLKFKLAEEFPACLRRLASRQIFS